MRIIVVSIAIWSFFTGCNSHNVVENKVDRKETITSITLSNALLKRAEVTYGKAEIRPLKETVSANGMIDVPSQNLASVSTPMAGYVTYSAILPGSYVNKGQVLAILEHQGYIELQQQFVQSISKLTLVEKEFARQQELGAENVNSVRDVQQAESDFKIEKALSNSLAEKLRLIGLNPSEVAQGNITSKISVRAPIKGYIKTANVSIGKFITPDLLIFEIVDVDHMHVELKVFEKDVLKVKKGQNLFFSVPTLDNKKIEATIVLLGKTFDNTTRTVGVHGHFDEKKYSFLLPGMYVNAQIIVDERDALTLPESALVRSGENYFAFEKKSKNANTVTFNSIQVEIGIKENGNVEIISPNDLNDKDLVISGAYFIQSEMSKTADEE